MKERLKKVLEELAGEIDDFRVYFQKPFMDGEWVAATDCYAIIRIKESAICHDYPQLPRKIDIGKRFPPKDCQILVNIEDLREHLKDEGYTDWDSRLGLCDECYGDGDVCYTYTDSFGDVHEMSGVCPICGGSGYVERDGVVKIADTYVKPKYLLLLCELAEATGGSVWLLNRGGTGLNCIYFDICDGIEMIIMPARPSIVKREGVLFKFEID